MSAEEEANVDQYGAGGNEDAVGGSSDLLDDNRLPNNNDEDVNMEEEMEKSEGQKHVGVFSTSKLTEEHIAAIMESTHNDDPGPLLGVLEDIGWDGSPVIHTGDSFPMAVFPSEFPLLMNAVESGCVRVTRALIERGDVSVWTQQHDEEEDNDGASSFFGILKFPPEYDPLNFCCRVQNLELTRLLLASGFNPNYVSVDGMTPLMSILSSQERGHALIPTFVRALLEAGADPNRKAARNIDRKFIDTPLAYAAFCEVPLEAVRFLLDAGADANGAGSSGETSLFHSRHPECTALLLERGADLHPSFTMHASPVLALDSFPLMIFVMTTVTTTAKWMEKRQPIVYGQKMSACCWIGVPTPTRLTMRG